MKETTLKEILKFNPCKYGLKNLLEGLKYSNPVTDEELNRPIKTRFIFDNNGYKDCLWVLQVFAGKPDWYRLKADIAESVLYIFEEKYPEDKRPREAIQAARDFANGKISKQELTAAYTYADAAAYDDAADAAAYADAADAAYAAREKQIKKNTEILLKYI
jgi:hypothetical protein